MHEVIITYLIQERLGILPTAPAQVEESSKLLFSSNKHIKNYFKKDISGSGHDRNQEKRVKERLWSQSHQTKAPSHYANEMSQQQQTDSRARKNYIKTQEENVYKSFQPKNAA